MTKHEPMNLTHMQSTPFDPNAVGYYNWGEWYPLWYTNWEEETLSWKKSCYIFTGNSAGMPATILKGPGATQLLNDSCVNNFTNMKVGATKHAIMCSEKGNIITHGLCLKTGEDEYTSYSLNPYLDYLASTGKYDVEFDAPYNKTYVVQLGGPRSLEIVENAAQEDLHDLKYLRFRNVMIAGHSVRVIRMGMAGTISYEIHGTIEGSIEVYQELMRVGEAYGLVKLGIVAYMSNHTEDGFPQVALHFPTASLEHPGLVDWLSSGDAGFYYDVTNIIAKGSLTQEKTEVLRNPVEVGWKHMIKFDHDFLGKEALEKIVADDNHRTMVTLVWNPEDIQKIFASYYAKDGAEPYKLLSFPQNFGDMGGQENIYTQDKVMKAGKMVGIAMRPVYTLYYRDTISQCSIDMDQAEIGNEVTVVWGDIGHRQIEIRATVARFPYLDLTPNHLFDVETIPRFTKA